MPKCKELILQVLASSDRPLAAHEMHIIGYSENNICTRLSEYARAGLVEGSYRKGKSFKEWRLRTGQLELIRKGYATDIWN